jgi:hypothetical protein
MKTNETYTIPYNYPVDKIIEMMLKRFFLNLQKVDKAKNITPEELHQKVILASIVEREAKKKEERPLMAGGGGGASSDGAGGDSRYRPDSYRTRSYAKHDGEMNENRIAR